MNLELLWQTAEKARSRARLTTAERNFVLHVAPREFAAFPHLKLPARVRHPGGFSVSGATVRTLVRCALLLSARRVLGPRYGDRSPFYARVESDLALRVMRSHFHHGDPKGTYCCPQCTLVLLPVLEARAIRWFDGAALAGNVRHLIGRNEWRFGSRVHPALRAWALGPL